MADLTIYSEPQNPALPASGFVLDLEHAALVITDPQIDFLSPEGVSWPVFGDSIRENNTVAHIGELLDAAKLAGITVAVSPHYFYPTDKQWRFGDPLEQFMSAVGMFGRQGAYTTDGFAGSGRSRRGARRGERMRVPGGELAVPLSSARKPLDRRLCDAAFRRLCPCQYK